MYIFRGKDEAQRSARFALSFRISSLPEYFLNPDLGFWSVTPQKTNENLQKKTTVVPCDDDDDNDDDDAEKRGRALLRVTLLIFFDDEKKNEEP